MGVEGQCIKMKINVLSLISPTTLRHRIQCLTVWFSQHCICLAHHRGAFGYESLLHEWLHMLCLSFSRLSTQVLLETHLYPKGFSLCSLLWLQTDGAGKGVDVLGKVWGSLLYEG